MNAHRWRQVRAEFDQLVEIDPSERAARLAEIGATDPELCRSVESLLAADAAADARLSGIESSLLTPGSASSSRPGHASAPAGPAVDPFGLTGRTVSHFHVLELLEAGGMGVVYRAEDTKLNRSVALKFLLPQYHLEPAAKARFLEEARSAAALDHPNLCTVLEIGESEDGWLFLAMPLYQGETLRARLSREGPLPVHAALEVARQIAEGLSCAHAAGIVHRDLKPGNLLLTSGGGVKILDFGLARVRNRSHTAPGVVMGTVAYMAPEQLRNREVDSRADLWALGVVLFEMLTGRRPFEGDHDLAVARAIVHDEPPQPSALRPDLPPAAEELVATLLRKDAADRLSSAEDLLSALVTLRSSAVQAPFAPRNPRRWLPRALALRAAGRWRLAAPLLAVVALGALGAAALAPRLLGLQGAGSVSVERSLAVLPFANLSAEQDNDYFAYGITEEILTTLASVEDLRVISRTSAMQYRESTKPVRQIAEELGVAHVLDGSVQRAGDRVRIRARLIDARTDRQLWAARYDRPLKDIFAVQSEIAGQIAQALRAELSPAEYRRLERRPTTSLLAHDYVLQARNLLQNPEPNSYVAALGLLREAIALDSSYADAFAAYSHAVRAFHFFEGEARWLDSATVAARRAVALDPAFAPGYAALGMALNVRGDRAAALEAYQQAVRLNPNLTEGLANLYHYDLGRLDEAARLWGHTLQSDPTNTISLWLAGRTYLDLGMPERAHALFERARKVQPDFHWLGYFRSAAYLVEGRPQEARAEIERTVAAAREDPNALLWSGSIMAALRDFPSARRYLERGLDGATDGWQRERAALTLSWILQQSAEVESARRYLRVGSDGFQARRGGQPRRPEDYTVSARIHVLQGDREAAIRDMRQAVSSGWRVRNDSPADPILGSLRGHPEYDRLMAQVEADLARQRARVQREGW